MTLAALVISVFSLLLCIICGLFGYWFHKRISTVASASVESLLLIVQQIQRQEDTIGTVLKALEAVVKEQAAEKAVRKAGYN